MKFYLVYKNHGLYDPILDDSEEICLPIGPNDLDQEANVQELRQGQKESKVSQDKTKAETENSILDPSKPYRPCSAGTLEEPIILNLNCKDVFPELSLDELPAEIKYKLPVSEQYDPEGKKVKEKAVYDKNIIVDFETIKKLSEQYYTKQIEEMGSKEDVINKRLFEKKENVEVCTDEYKLLNVLEEESELRKMKQTATQVKEKVVYEKNNVIVDFEKIKKLAEQYHAKQAKEITLKKDVIDKSLFEKKENLQVGKDKYEHLNVLEKENELRKIKQTAKQVIEDSLSKAMSVANQLKNKSEYKSSDPLYYEQNRISSSKQSVQQSNKQKVKLIKKVSFEDDYIKEDMSSEEASKREVRVADEIKKFETFDLQMDSKLNEEERKLLTRRDIEEAIEVGTVRQRTGMLTTGTEKIVADKLDQKTLETVKSEVKSNLELAKQRVYKIGLQIIPRIRASVKSSRQSTMLLKRFLLQITKVMIKLYKCIPVEKRYNFSKSKQVGEEKKKSREFIHKIDSGDEVFRRDTFMNGAEEIKKPKLSGAKIAQIEGLKPAELTDRMNIVISEFLRKSGKEQIFDDKEVHHSLISESERRTHDEFLNDTYFSEKTFEESQTGDQFIYDSSFSEKTFDKSKSGHEYPDGTPFRENGYENRKLFEEMSESKTKSYEMREMKEEKRYSESKTSKYDSKQHLYETDSTTRDDASVPLTYIAIVEAHVYTNKNAIFEEQMRRMSESTKHSDFAESGIIYYRCEVCVFYRQFREPSLPPTVVIESIEEIPSEQVFDEERQELLQTCETGYEDTAKKLAVQKISEVIEPLLQIKEVKYVNIKRAYPSFEMPLKLISEQATVTMDKEENILHESKLIEESYISIEEPLKSVGATSEIKDEEISGFVEIVEIEECKPRPILEPSQAIAETAEIFIAEEIVGMLDIPQPVAQLPHPVKIEKAIKTVAETSEVIVDEANLEILDVSKTISATPRYKIADNLRSIAETMIVIIEEPKSQSKEVSKITGESANVGVDEIIASEVFEVLPEEPVYEEVVLTETKRRQSEVFLEKSLLVLPEIILTSTEEPICEELILTKAQSKVAKVGINANVVAEITEISLSEREQETFDVVKITEKEPGAPKEKSVLSVCETQTILPFEPSPDIFDSIKAINQQGSLTIEESKAAETTFIQVEEPKEAFEINENLKQQAHVEVEELKSATVSSVTVEEPKQEAIETHTFSNKEANTDMEASLLTVAENTIILPDGPHHGNLEIAQVQSKRPKTLIEDGLSVAETILVSPTSPEGDLNLIEKINQQANIRIEESKAITTSLICLEEPKEENLDVSQLLQKQPQALLQDSLLPVAITLEVLPEGPKDEGLMTHKTISEKAQIEIEECKSASVTFVSVEEPKTESLERFSYEEKRSESLLENPVLNVAETFDIVPEGPLYDRLETPAIPSCRANIFVEEIKPLTISVITPNEPQEIAVVVPKVKDINPQFLTEDRYLPVVEVTAVEPDEPKDSFTLVPVKNEKADVKIGEFKGTSITVVYSEEPKEEDLKLPMVQAKQQQPVLEAVHLTAAETSLILSEESKITFDVTKTSCQLAHIEVIEQKAAEASLVFSLDSRDKDLVIEEIIEKTSKALVESPFLTAAENSIIISEEKVEELPKSTKPADQKATVHLEGLKLPNTVIIFSNEPTPVVIEVAKLDKKEPCLTVEQTVKAVAVLNICQLAHIEVIEQKAAEACLVFSLDSRDKDLVIEEIIEKTSKALVESPFLTAAENSIIISEEKVEELPKYTKPADQKATVHLEGLKLPNTIIIFTNEPTPVVIEVEKLDKKEPRLTVEQTVKAVAVLNIVQISELRKEITVDIKDIDISSASSTISSAPSSPFIQEYVFGVFDVATGHEYRVQSPQETELHIRQPAQDLYGVDSANTSYTLTFEAAYEEEKEILQLEEFGDVVKKNQFWISDVKTMQTVESSDARIHLMDVIMGIEASIQDSTVGIKSRSQSFDTSADYELSLQSSDQSEVRETQISDVRAVATIDLKSEASFKTMQDVESQAKVQIKSKSAKAYSAQSVDVVYGLTNENEVVADDQSIELDVQSSMESKAVSAKSTKRRVKKEAKSMALETSETGTEASCPGVSEMSVKSTSISQESYKAMEKGVAKKSYAAVEGSLESRSIAKGSYATMEANIESNKVSEASYSANVESSNISQGSYAEKDTSLQSRSISKSSYATVEADLEVSAISEASYSSKQARIKSSTSKSTEIDARQKMILQGLTEISQVGTMDKQHRSLKTDLKEIKAKVSNDAKSPSPEDIRSTPLRDVYIFRLHTPAPEETTFIPRDCSFTPESVHEDEIVIVNGMIPHIDTKIVRVLYSPPLETPPTSPVRKVEPVFTKPGLRGGSETPEFLKLESKSGSRTPEFTKEEILEIGRKSALLASEIDRTIRSIEEYKESVGIGTKADVVAKKEKEETTATTESFENKVEKENNPQKKRKNLNTNMLTEKVQKGADKISELDVRKANDKSRQSILSRFSQF